jgi:carbon storage regulator
MLVLSRKPGEEILIGDNVRLVVHSIRGNRVRLGIAAPEGVPIARAELLERGSPVSCRQTVGAKGIP